MSSVKEIKARIEGVKETRKITNAMYLVASTKLRHARENLDRTRPYFEATRREVARVFRTGNAIDSRYFFDEDGAIPKKGVCGVLVITADKGLAGSYNMNAIRKAEAILREKPDARLFVVGEYGRRYFRMRHIDFEQDFRYTAQDPTLDRAREICTLLLDKYDGRELNEILAVYTDMKSSLSSTAQVDRLLPLERRSFVPKHGVKVGGGKAGKNGTPGSGTGGPNGVPGSGTGGPNGVPGSGTGGPNGGPGSKPGGTGVPNGGTSAPGGGVVNSGSGTGGAGVKNAVPGGGNNGIGGDAEAGERGAEFLFSPSLEAVLAAVMRSYVSGFFYSAMVNSFCCEQNARVTAMDAAGRNADELLGQLSLQLNRERQSAITQEITEISAGAKAQRQKNRKEASS